MVADTLPEDTLFAEHYRIERVVGRGGMATVYAAKDIKHRRPVALKILHRKFRDALAGERFLREIELTGNLQHQNIVALFDSGDSDGMLYYVMPLVEGQSLRARIREQRQLPIEEAIRIATDVATALRYAHSRRIVHRDIKPENILLSGNHALVVDFGIAKAMDAAGEQLTATGFIVGTPAYISPEQASGERQLDASSDIYALGCVLYEMLAGEPPFAGSTQAVIAGTPPSVRAVRKEVPVHVERAINRALALSSAGRFSDAADFASALRDNSLRARASAWVFQSPLGRAAGILLIGLGAVVWASTRRGASDAREEATEPVASVGPLLLSPESVTVLAGTNQQLRATRKGRVLNDRSVKWRVENGNGKISDEGIVSSLIPDGTFTVSASIDGDTAKAIITAVTLVRMVAGSNHTCGRTEAGDTYCWGANTSSQLGDGSTVSRQVATRVLGGASFTKLAAGDSHTCAIGSASSCWGLNTFGQVGAGGAVASMQRQYDLPTSIAGGRAWVEIAAGASFTCGLTSGALAYCWGNSEHGRTGSGSLNSSINPTPRTVTGAHRFVEISAGDAHACAITPARSAYCWGNGSSGQLGNNSTTQTGTPVLVQRNLKYTALRLGGSHTCGLAADSLGYCWGSNQFGQLGIGIVGGSRLVPTPISMNLRFIALSTGSNHSCGITKTGDAYCWGDNTLGQLGIGAAGTAQSTPRPVMGEYKFTGIRSGGNHTCGLASERGVAVCWGQNDSGELGDGTTAMRPAPVPVRGH